MNFENENLPYPDDADATGSDVNRPGFAGGSNS
jgi:hypothetical protein